MRPRVLSAPAEIEALAPAWEDLLSRSACDVPFLSPQWLLPWWRVFGPLGGRVPLALCFEMEGRLAGLALLCFRRHTYRPGIPFRRVELWGSGEDEADSICSDYLNVIAEKGQEPAVAAAFAQTLTGWASPWHEMVVPLMDASHPMPGLLRESFAARGLSAELVETTEAHHISLPPTWQEFIGQLGRKERYLIKRSERDFDEWAAGTAILHEALSEEDLERGAAILRNLHAERWQRCGTFRSPRFLEFHHRAMRAMRAAGTLRLIWLTVRGEPVAAMYSVVRGGKVAFYQCGRKLDVPRNIRPGGVILYRAIRRAIEEGLNEFDFLADDAVYKRQLAQASRPLVTLRVARPGLREQARLCVEWGKGLLRKLFRRPVGPPAAMQRDET